MEKDPLLLVFGISTIFFTLLMIFTMLKNKVIFARVNLLLLIISLLAFVVTYIGVTNKFAKVKPPSEDRKNSIAHNSQTEGNPSKIIEPPKEQDAFETNEPPKEQDASETIKSLKEQDVSETIEPLTAPKLTLQDLQIGPLNTGLTSLDVQELIGRPPDETYISNENHFTSSWGERIIAGEREENSGIISLMYANNQLNYQTPRGIKIGDSIEDVHKAYGYKKSRNNIVGYYQMLSETDIAYISFATSNGLVVAIYIRHELR
ncbi:hypothetical protein BBR47_17000 [Brevibacillus brevis NBRC 100599]|uniref:Uncharacterized protein n=1 Tax=Brevibacillus brevis (strain 47 / JCM 6285 / NBRC 100599) TaxID=358681 RepID=C0Z9K7_BREBN|nr:hypothetical protein [Brevibacillus brevis]BAH42677.1 hypothetical protein BBR47_17000 [Brevibacillus brevis NBRC 100599]